MKENFKVVATALIFSFLFIGCDTAGSSSSGYTVVTSDGGSGGTTTIVTPSTDGTVTDTTTNVVSGKYTVTSARGDTPPSPPVIESE